MKKLLLIIGCVTLFLSCQESGQTTGKVVTEEVSDTPYFEPGYEYIQLKPDSLKTAEDLELIEKLKEMHTHLKAENNKVVFSLSKEEFLAKGIPEQYYVLIQKDIVNINKMLKENKETNVDSILKESAKNMILK
ncbi:hypothetical protein [Sphingobacterium lactis]|uniref:hypothetical protein n=1 Tax=Sphingobacterium lactis TaxID=797291 RepID=UPI003DA3F278